MTVRQHGLFSKTVPTWQHAKQGDYITGANDLGIDTGVIIEGEGTLFLSQGTLKEMVEVMGWNVTVDVDSTIAALEQDLAWAQRRAEQLEAENAGLKADLEAFGRALAQHAGRAK